MGHTFPVELSFGPSVVKIVERLFIRQSRLFRSIANTFRTGPVTVASESAAWVTFAVVEQIDHTAC